MKRRGLQRVDKPQRLRCLQKTASTAATWADLICQEVVHFICNFSLKAGETTLLGSVEGSGAVLDTNRVLKVDVIVWEQIRIYCLGCLGCFCDLKSKRKPAETFPSDQLCFWLL